MTSAKRISLPVKSARRAVSARVPRRPPGGKIARRRIAPRRLLDDPGRQIQRTMTGGALGGGALLVGFGLVPGVIGAVIGALLGYLFERSVATHASDSAA